MKNEFFNVIKTNLGREHSMVCKKFCQTQFYAYDIIVPFCEIFLIIRGNMVIDWLLVANKAIGKDSLLKIRYTLAGEVDGHMIYRRYHEDYAS